jgi:serine/threonine-protein kinase RsbW
LGLGVQYRAGGVGLEVGGDWYDAFWVDDQSTVALVVGDVVGRGIAAAATMGQLRSAVRALAASGMGPGALLQALDRFSQRHDVGLNTTLVYAELNLAQGALVWACAGHPPPVLLEAGADPRLLMDGRSAPIDAYVGDVRPLVEGHATLAASDVILFYTDGLVERRGVSIDRGIELLLETARLETGEDAPRMARRVFESLRDTEHSDDTCIVAAQLCPPS